MFYQKEENNRRACITLSPAEAKRLIAEAVAGLPEVKNALQNGWIIVAGGTTNAYIARLLTGENVDINRYTAGRIEQSILTSTPKEERLKPVILQNGNPVEITIKDALQNLKAGDVFIKGANAVDVQGNIGILVSNENGGTIGSVWGAVMARGVDFICPVGLEKLIASVPEAAAASGQNKFMYCHGNPVGLLAVTGAKVVTEVEAIRALYQVEAVHIASGGILDSEGAVVLSLAGEEGKIKSAWEGINTIKGQS